MIIEIFPQDLPSNATFTFNQIILQLLELVFALDQLFILDAKLLREIKNRNEICFLRKRKCSKWKFMTTKIFSSSNNHYERKDVLM